MLQVSYDQVPADQISFYQYMFYVANYETSLFFSGIPFLHVFGMFLSGIRPSSGIRAFATVCILRRTFIYTLPFADTLEAH